MRLQLGLLAQAANTTAGDALNILGEFNVVTIAQDAPVAMPAVLVVRLVEEGGQLGDHVLGIRLRADDGQLLWSSPDQPFRLSYSGYPGLPSRLQCIVQLHPLTLPGAGDFSFEIIVDGIRLEPEIEVHVVAAGPTA